MIIASDMHFRLVDDSALQRLVEACRADNDGVLILAGDLTQHGDADEYEQLAQLLSELMSSGLRVVCCPGNHDLSYLLGYGPSTTRRRTGRYLDHIAGLVNGQSAAMSRKPMMVLNPRARAVIRRSRSLSPPPMAWATSVWVPMPGGSPAAWPTESKGWWRWPGLWQCHLRCCCWMSRRPG